MILLKLIGPYRSSGIEFFSPENYIEAKMEEKNWILREYLFRRSLMSSYFKVSNLRPRKDSE